MRARAFLGQWNRYVHCRRQVIFILMTCSAYSHHTSTLLNHRRKLSIPGTMGGGGGGGSTIILGGNVLPLSIFTFFHTDILHWDRPDLTWMSAISQNSTANVISLINWLPIWELLLLLWNPESPLATETHLAAVVYHFQGYYSGCPRRPRDGSTHCQNTVRLRYNTTNRMQNAHYTCRHDIGQTCIGYIIRVQTFICILL